MAGSPATQKQSSPSKEDRLREAVVEAFAEGKSVSQIAKKLARGDPKRYHHWYNKITRMVRRDVLLQTKIDEVARGEAWLGLIPATQAMVARAGRGRMDAVKFLFSYTGAFSEKQQVEHSGGIELNLNIGRPAPVTDRTKRMDLEEGIVDAEVVEEDDPGT